MADRPAPEVDLLDQMRAERDARAQELWECRRLAAQLAIERQNQCDAAAAARAAEQAAEARRHAAEAARDGLGAECDGLRAALDVAWAERDAARAEAHDNGAMLHRVTTSTAWRVTGPPRRLAQWLLRR